MSRSSTTQSLLRLLTTSLTLSCVFFLYGCGDEVQVSSPCDDVVCGDNAFCADETGTCECDAGLEMHEGVCAPPHCTSDQECDDGIACNGAEQCDSNTGACRPGTDITCGENGVCEEPSGECVCPPLYIDDGSGCVPKACQEDADCDDDLACNGVEACDQELQQCVAGNPVHCGQYERCEESLDGNICTVDVPEGHSACMLIGTTDWAAVGALAVMDLETGEIEDNITTYAQDSAIRVVDEDVYVLERHMYNAVLKLDQRDDYKALWNMSVATDEAPNPNPHDIVRHGAHVFIALYNEGVILRANPTPTVSDPTSFLGAEPYMRRIDPPQWDGAVAELTALRVEGDILYGLTQGLDDAWSCGSAENTGRIWAFHLPDLTDAYVFEGDKNYLNLAHCNPGGWVPMPDGRLLIHSLGGYRSYQGTEDDGGLQIFDSAKRALGPVVASETTAHDNDILSIVRVGLQYFAILAGTDFNDLGVHEVYPTADDSTWSVDTQAFYNGYAWALFGFEDTLYIAERSPASEALYAYDVDDKTPQGSAIETTYAPESMRIFYREGGCW